MATIVGRYWASHTYVTSTDGYAWECGGGTYGNTNQLCAGTANTSIADCISQGWKSMAALGYGIDGVCHQAANRIMYETRNLVWYPYFFVSIPLYGHYGGHPINYGVWEQRKSSCGVVFAPTPARVMSKSSRSLSPKEKRDTKYSQDLLTLGAWNKKERFQKYGESKDLLSDTGSLNEELKIFLEHQLERSLGKKMLKEITNAQNRLFQNSFTARSNLLNDSDSPEKNADDINNKLSICLNDIKGVLGLEDYQRAFETNETEAVVVVPEIAKNASREGAYKAFSRKK